MPGTSFLFPCEARINVYPIVVSNKEIKDYKHVYNVIALGIVWFQYLNVLSMLIANLLLLIW